MFKSIFLIAQIVGVIAGKVVNSTTGEGIPSASVFVEGTTLGASTDKNGIYFIKDVPVGRYTLIATAVGYQTEKLQVVVVPGEIVMTNFNLTPETEKTKQLAKTQDKKSESKFPYDLFLFLLTLIFAITISILSSSS
jgi:outer membrane receptor for ferrienterochelin and colicins